MNAVEKMIEGVDVFVQSNTNTVFQYFLINELDDTITLTADASPDDETIDVSAGHGFSAGEMVVLWQDGYFRQITVKSVNVNELSLSVPVSLPFTVADCVVVRGSKNLAVNGTTPKTFTFKPRAGIVPIDIGSIIITMDHPAAGDPSKFGDLTALTNGMYVRKHNGSITALGNYKKNADFNSIGGDITFYDKAGGGAFGTKVDVAINTPEHYDTVIRIDSGNNDELQVRIRDDISAITSIEFSLLGSLTTGE